MKAANLLFVGFLKNENSLKSFSLIFENSSPKKGFSWQSMKKSPIVQFWRRIIDLFLRCSEKALY